MGVSNFLFSGRKAFSLFLKAIGFFPYVYFERQQQYVISATSWQLWSCVLVFAISLTGAQAILALISECFIQKIFKSIGISFHGILLLLLVFVELLHMLIIAFNWLDKAPKFFQIEHQSRHFRLNDIHDFTQSDFREASGRRLFIILILCGICSIILVTACSFNLTFLLFAKLQEPGITQLHILPLFPPLAYTLTNDKIATACIVAFGASMMHFAASLCELTCIALSRRVRYIANDLIQDIKSLPDLQLAETPLAKSKKPFKKDIRALRQNIDSVKDLFENYAETSSAIFFLEVGYNIIVAIIAVFHIIQSIANSQMMEAATIEVAIVVVLFHAIFKLVVLANTGEQWLQKTCQLHEAVAALAPSDVTTIDSASWTNSNDNLQLELLHLKQYVTTIKLHLTGCGFFVLSRETFTSIVGSIVTYIIVLVQFDPDKGQKLSKE